MDACSSPFGAAVVIGQLQVDGPSQQRHGENATLDVLVARQVRQQVLTKYFPNVSALAGGYYALNPLVEFGIDDIGNAEARQWLHNMYAEYGAALGLPNSLSMCEKGYTVGVTAVQPVLWADRSSMAAVWRSWEKKLPFCSRS